MDTEYLKIYQRQDSRANLGTVIRDKFLCFDTDNNHLLYSKDGTSFFDFYNSREIDSKVSSITWANILSKPTTLSGLGIPSSDPLFDSTYLKIGINSDSIIEGACNLYYTDKRVRTVGDLAYLPISGIDASKVTSGTFDLARIPVLPSMLQIVSSGDLTALTTAQQAQIGQGTVVTTIDGSRLVYTGSGSKTAAASYVLLADITPDWSVISNRPINVSTWTNDAGYLTSSSSLAWGKLTGVPTTLSGFGITASDSLLSKYLTGNQTITLTGAVTGSGTTSIATSFANTHLAGINQDLTTTSGPTFGQASLGAWAPGPAYAWFGAAGQNNNTNGNSGFLQANFGYVYMCAPSGAIAEIQYSCTGYLRVNSSGVSILQDAPLLSVVPPSTFAGLITANGGISGNLTGHASLDLPLTGGTMSGNLLGGTPYNIGATSNWWGSIYATTIYESNVALSSKYLGVNGTASNAAALGGKSPSWYLPGGQYFIPGSAGAPDYTLLFTVVFSSQYQGFNNEVYISGRFDASRYSIAIGNDANTANVYVSKFGSPIGDAGRIKYIVTNTSSYHNTVKVYLVRLSWDYTTDYSFGSSTGSYDSYAENSSPTPTTTDPGVTAPTLSTFGYNTIANTVTAAGGFVGSLTGHASLDLPLSGGTMNAGAKILTLQDMTINTGANGNYSSAPFVAQRNTIDGTTTHASIGFHNRGVNGAALFYHAGYSNFWFNDNIGGLYQLWSSKDFASQSITNWTTAYNWGNHASAGYLLSSTAASTYLPIGGTASDASALGGVAADNFVQGTNASRTTQLTTSGTSWPQLLKSGFYDSTHWTDFGSSWVHMIHCAHSDDAGTSNRWSFDIIANFAGSVGGGEHYYVRTVADGTPLTWRELIHSANYQSYNNFTTGLSTTTLTVNGNSNITGTTDLTGGLYLRQGAFALNSAGSGWTQWYDRNGGSPIITAAGGFIGNLTGHASLDIPLTGSSALSGNLCPAVSGGAALGTSTLKWGNVYAAAVRADGVYGGAISGSSVYSDIIATNAGGQFISQGKATFNGQIWRARQTQSGTYTVSYNDCGKILNLSSTNDTAVIGTASNYSDGFWVDILIPGGGQVAATFKMTDPCAINGTNYGAGKTISLQNVMVSVWLVETIWIVRY